MRPGDGLSLGLLLLPQEKSWVSEGQAGGQGRQRVMLRRLRGKPLASKGWKMEKRNESRLSRHPQRQSRDRAWRIWPARVCTAPDTQTP